MLEQLRFEDEADGSPDCRGWLQSRVVAVFGIERQACVVGAERGRDRTRRGPCGGGTVFREERRSHEGLCVVSTQRELVVEGLPTESKLRYRRSAGVAEVLSTDRRCQIE